MRHFGDLAGRCGGWVAVTLAGLLGAGLLSGCDEKPRPPERSGGVAADPFAHARRVSEEKLRAGLRTPAVAQFRGVQAYQQSDTRVVAVCGQVNPAGREDQAFVPFVSVVTYEKRPDTGPSEFDVEQYVATSNSEATRVYIEMASRCGENGGPRQVGSRRMIPPLPPLPSDLPDQLQAAQPARAAPAAPAPPSAPMAPRPAEPVGSPLSGQGVVMRQAGNIRVAPVGGSQLVRVAPKGAALKVFAQAPGGWLQVGETDPEGWVHSSLVRSDGRRLAAASPERQARG